MIHQYKVLYPGNSSLNISVKIRISLIKIPVYSGQTGINEVKLHGKSTLFIFSDKNRKNSNIKIEREFNKGKPAALKTESLTERETLIFPSGDKYVGGFKNDEFHGDGVWYYADGSRYIGNFSESRCENKGLNIWSDGTMYISAIDSYYHSEKNTYMPSA